MSSRFQILHLHGLYGRLPVTNRVATPRQFAANPRQFTAIPRSSLLTPVSLLLTPASLLLTPVSSLLTPVVSRPLPLTQGAGSCRPPAAMLPSPPTEGVRVAAVLTPLGGQSSQPLHAAPPATSPLPPWGLRAGRPCRTILQFYLPPPVWPHAALPPHPLGEGSEPTGRPGPVIQLCASNLHPRIPPESGPSRPHGLKLSATVPA